MTTEPYWLFSASIESPDGMVVTTTAHIPSGTPWKRVSDASELVQMGAASTLARISDAIKREFEEAPF